MDVQIISIIVGSIILIAMIGYGTYLFLSVKKHKGERIYVLEIENDITTREFGNNTPPLRTQEFVVESPVEYESIYA